MAVSRREALLMMGGAAALLGVRRFAGLPAAEARTNVPKAPNRPRYWVFIMTGGGWDGVLTLDPKTKKQVERSIDVPYAANAIVAGAGIPLAPQFAPLKRWTKQMSVIHGVKVSAANHEYATMQWLRLKRVVQTSNPTIMDVLGQHRDGQPLGGMALGPAVPYDYSTGFIGTRGNYYGNPTKFKYSVYNRDEETFWDELDKISPDEMAAMAKALRRDEHYLTGLGGTRNQRAARAAADSAALFEKLPAYTKYQPEDWGADQDAGDGYGVTNYARTGIGRDFQRALWALQNDMCKTVYLRIGLFEWDTHFLNWKRQQTWNAHFSSILDKFLEKLQTTKNEHGTLASQTTIVVGSELGRFPKINPHEGKDHFPELPHLLIGPNIVPGKVFGETDREMVGLPVDLATGRPKKGGAYITLDDLGTTVLALDGIRNPDTFGYGGRVLRYLGA